jgi:hypothetical protein
MKETRGVKRGGGGGGEEGRGHAQAGTGRYGGLEIGPIFLMHDRAPVFLSRRSLEASFSSVRYGEGRTYQPTDRPSPVDN